MDFYDSKANDLIIAIRKTEKDLVKMKTELESTIPMVTDKEIKMTAAELLME